jgi:hypothetical protein
MYTYILGAVTWFKKDNLEVMAGIKQCVEEWLPQAVFY